MLGESDRRPRPAGRSDERPLRRGQGGGAAVQPLLRRRLAARARDALDRRGDGHRAPTSRPRSRRPRPRRVRRCPTAARCSSRSPTPTRRRARGSPRSCTTSASRSSRPRGTAQAIQRMGVPVRTLRKVAEGSPHVVDAIASGEVDLVINTPTGSGARSDGWEIRRAAVARGIPCITTLSGGQAATRAIRAAREGEPAVVSLQEVHGPDDARRSVAARGARSSAGGRAATSCSVTPTTRRARSRASSTCSPRGAVGWRRGGAAVSRPGGVGDAASARRASSSSCSRTSDPGTHRLCELEAGEGIDARRTARPRLLAPARRTRCSSAGGSASRRCRRAGAWGGARAARLPRRASTRPPPRSSARPLIATDDGSVGHHGVVTELLDAS